MSKFIGKAIVAVDQKGRASLPLEFRKQWSQDLGSQVVVTLFADQSLILRPIATWEAYLQKELHPVSKLSPEGSRFALKITSMAKLSILDNQNRILLSSELLEYAQIKKEVVFAGDGTSIRLWSPEIYHKMMNTDSSPTFEALFYHHDDKK